MTLSTKKVKVEIVLRPQQGKYLTQIKEINKNQGGKEMKKIHITVPAELKDKIIFIAEKKSRSINFIANEALTTYVRKFKLPKERK